MSDPDPIDRMVDQWRVQRPDLDVDLEPMALIARLGRLNALAAKSIDLALQAHLPGGTGDFDVLAALRRAGEPFALQPSELARSIMLSPAGMTSRLDRLEALGFIERRADQSDRRVMLAALTAKGRAAIDAAVEDHLTNEARLLEPLSGVERQTLNDLLRKLLSGFASPDGFR